MSIVRLHVVSSATNVGSERRFDKSTTIAGLKVCASLVHLHRYGLHLSSFQNGMFFGYLPQTKVHCMWSVVPMSVHAHTHMHIQGKLEMITGSMAASMELHLQDSEGNDICVLDQDDAMLGAYPVQDYLVG